MAAASAILVPISLLAVYGISLRIAQHGWTTDRIVAIACAAVAVCYAVGYLAAAVRWNSVFARLETTNIAVAFLLLALLLALFTPLADPARMSVADQMRRLDAGLIAPEKLDYLYLRFDAGRYGVEALRVLAGQKAVPLVAEQAAAALALQSREGAGSLAGSLTSDERASNLSVVHPRGQPLPREFLETNWSDDRHRRLPACLTGNAQCDAVMADLDGDNLDEIILLPSTTRQVLVFRRAAGQTWDYFGQMSNAGCEGVREALAPGNFSILASRAKEIEAGGRRLRLIWPADCAGGGTVAPQ